MEVPEDSGFGAFLADLSLDASVLWNGTIRVTWTQGQVRGVVEKPTVQPPTTDTAMTVEASSTVNSASSSVNPDSSSVNPTSTAQTTSDSTTSDSTTTQNSSTSLDSSTSSDSTASQTAATGGKRNQIFFAYNRNL